MNENVNHIGDNNQVLVTVIAPKYQWLFVVTVHLLCFQFHTGDGTFSFLCNIERNAVIVVFQPELRKALEQLGKGKFFTAFARSSEETDDKAAQRTVDEIVKAAEKMGSVKTGALILIEQKVPLGDFERTGIPVDAIVSSQLLINIFEHNTPLHDGAVIVRRNRVAAATCFLPLTDSNEVSMELGTRHRAAIGASEVSDAYVIVVSEETGAISLARGGVLYRDLSPEQLKNMISQPRKEGSKKTFATIWKGRQEKE